jgi:hypothetical protein
MSGRPALVRSRDVKAVMLAARKLGAKEVLVKPDGSMVIPLVPAGDESVEPDDSNNSFDKIMRAK